MLEALPFRNNEILACCAAALLRTLCIARCAGSGDAGGKRVAALGLHVFRLRLGSAVGEFWAEVADQRREFGLGTRLAAFSGENHFSRRWPVSG